MRRLGLAILATLLGTAISLNFSESGVAQTYYRGYRRPYYHRNYYHRNYYHGYRPDRYRYYREYRRPYYRGDYRGYRRPYYSPYYR